MEKPHFSRQHSETIHGHIRKSGILSLTQNVKDQADPISTAQGAGKWKGPTIHVWSQQGSTQLMRPCIYYSSPGGPPGRPALGSMYSRTSTGGPGPVPVVWPASGLAADPK